MKPLYNLLILLVLASPSCKKDLRTVVESVSVNVINGAIDAGPIKVNPGAESNFYYAAATEQVAFGANKLYSTIAGNRTITVVSAADTTKILFKGGFNLLQPMNTLCIVGQSPTFDTIFREEKNIPYIRRDVITPDSSINVRFANLSPNSPAINVNIASSATNEVSGLAYKGFSDFKNYPAKSTTGNYIFEVRNASTNALLTTYTLSAASNRFKTVTLVLKGLTGTASGTNALSISTVGYY